MDIKKFFEDKESHRGCLSKTVSSKEIQSNKENKDEEEKEKVKKEEEEEEKKEEEEAEK